MSVTYSAVTSGEKDAESPLTASLADKWSNNLLAVIENDATAPEIDGAAITNLTIPYAALNLSNSIVLGDMEAGTNQQTLFAVVGDFTSVTASGWNAIYVMSIYVPSSATSLAYVGWLRNATSGQDNSLRIVAGIETGSTAGVNGSTYAQTTEGTLDVSASSGWLTINIQLNREGGTETFIRSMSTRFI